MDENWVQPMDEEIKMHKRNGTWKFGSTNVSSDT